MQEPIRWMTVVESASDPNLGRTLLRLARLAETAHRHAVADSLRKDPVEIHGRIPGSVTHDGSPRVAGSHTEVGR